MLSLKRITKRIIVVLACFLLLSTAKLDVNAAETTPAKTSGLTSELGIFVYAPIAEGVTAAIGVETVGGKQYMFLPSSMSPKSLVFHYGAEGKNVTMVKDGAQSPLPSDAIVDITPFLSADLGDGSKVLNIQITDAAGKVSSHELYVMQSSGISSIYIKSGNPNQGREYIEASKSNKTSGSMVMLGKGGNLIYSGGLSQIKGRGNTTFGASKKPYQIKLDTATDLLLTGVAANSDKTWILLANAYDPTMIHNTVGYRMAKSMGLNVPDCAPVDLYYDGIYRGTYLLTEKVQLGAGRVAINNLEKQTEDANGGKDLSKLAIAKGTNKYGDVIQYVNGVVNPADISGGYLLELDDAYYSSERSYFITSTGSPFVIKSPENCSKEQVEYISDYVEEMIQAAANGGINPTNERSVWEYIDKTSLTRYFVLQEVTKNADSFCSSTYFYLNNDGKPMTVGPVWDLDDSYGIRADVASTEAFVSDRGMMKSFMELPEFRTSVKQYYNSKGYSLAMNAGIDKAASEIAASQKMNRILWNNAGQLYQKLESYESDVAYMNSFAKGRAAWLKGVFATW